MSKSILVTGGKGKLGIEVRRIINADFVDLEEMDISNSTEVRSFFNNNKYDIVIHLAADTNLRRCEDDIGHAFQINVKGTENIANICKSDDIYLIYPSTDYVFDGNKGQYVEKDATNPVNYYAYTKLIGEYIVKSVNRHLILRGTMKEREKWRHPFAPTDMYESLLHHDEYAEFMVKLIEREAQGVFHVGKGRFSVYEWAHDFDPEVEPKTIEEIGFPLPKDSSLNTNKMETFLNDNPEPIIDIRIR